MDAVVEAGARKPRKSLSKSDRRMIRRPCVSQPLSCDYDGALDRASLGPRRVGSEYGGAALHRDPALEGSRQGARLELNGQRWRRRAPLLGFRVFARDMLGPGCWHGR